MTNLLLVASIVAIQHLPAPAPAPAPAPPAAVAWCDGAYDPVRGTNFGACPNSGTKPQDVQSPGDEGK